MAKTIIAENTGLVDKWSLVHAGFGASSAALGLNPWLFMGIAIAYEALEFRHESPSGSRIFGTKGPETTENLVADLAVSFAAYALVTFAKRG